MDFSSIKHKFLPFQLLALATFIISALFMWQGNIGFSLWDEGFLWYGSQRTMLGEVPIRDFMAYEPGRYYWTSTFMRLWGDNGIMTLRGTIAIFQTMGLFIGLLLISQSVKNHSICYLFLSAIILVVWMSPRHKLFDISLSIFLIGILTFLVQKPVIRRYFLTGICLGLIAIFGRNHGIYGAVASVAIIVWLSIKNTDKPGLINSFASWSIGVVLGFSPVLFMMLLVPGFAISFWKSILFMFEVKATNLPLPIPWPWRLDIASVTLGEAIRGILVGLFFIALIVFGFISIFWVVWQKLQKKPVSPVIVAASFLSLPYSHFAYSRTDISHLAQGIFPVLIGCLVLIASQQSEIKWPLALTLCAASLWVMTIFQPGWQCQSNKPCVNIKISGSDLIVNPGTANDISLLRKLADKYAPDGQSFIATPFWPGAYALLERKSPMWEIYALFPRSQTFEQAEIERIKSAKPGFALILDLPLDRRDDLRFRNTHPMIHQYIRDHFERLPDSPSPAYQIYKSKEHVQ